MMLFDSLGSVIEILVIALLCLIISNLIIFGLMLYVLFIIELVDSLKYSRRIGKHVDQYFENKKKLGNEPKQKISDFVKEVFE